MKCKECKKTMKFVDSSLSVNTTSRNYFCPACGISTKSVEVDYETMKRLKDSERQLKILKNGINLLYRKVEQ